MFEWAIIGFLVGTVLSLHFKMHVLFLVSFVLVVVAIGRGIRGDAILWIELETVLIATSVQLGFFIGGVVYLMIDRKSGRRTRTSPRPGPVTRARDF